MKTNKEKSKKLEEKIDKLVEKIENEKSKTKRLAYIIKCKMLVNKLEREINLKKEKAKFQKYKEDINISTMEEKVATRNKIIVLNKEIKNIERDLKANKEYDFKSSDFMFPQEDIENAGGIAQYSNELEESEDPEQIKTAEKMREARENRIKLEYLKRDLKEEKENLEELNSGLKYANNIISRKEMMVVAKSKFNIFAKIRNFASSVVSGVRQFREEAKENRMVNKEKVANFQELQSTYWEAREKIRQEYEQKMEKLNVTYIEVDKKISDKWEKFKAEKNSNKRNTQAYEFREKLQNIIKTGEQVELEHTVGEDEEQERIEGQEHHKEEQDEEIETYSGEVVDGYDDGRY